MYTPAGNSTGKMDSAKAILAGAKKPSKGKKKTSTGAKY